MALISRYLVNISKEDIISNLKKSPVDLKDELIKKYRIGNFVISSQAEGFIHGKLAVKRVYDDYWFDIVDDYEIETKPEKIEISDDVMFTIYPDIKCITFSSKEGAKLFGMELLSKILFGEGGKIFGLTFYPQKVLEAKRQGKFKNVWYNGLKFDGKIGYVGQFGNEIDEDIKFLNNPEKRLGIGIVFSSRNGKNIKLAIFKDGCILRKTKMRDIRDELKLDKEIIKIFLDYSNYGDNVPKKTADELKSLNDYFE